MTNILLSIKYRVGTEVITNVFDISSFACIDFTTLGNAGIRFLIFLGPS